MLRALAFLWLSAHAYTPLRPHEGVSYALEVLEALGVVAAAHRG